MKPAALMACGTVALLLFGAGGCATTQVDQKMQAWVGKSIDELVAEWGAPQQSLDDGRGGHILTWFEQRYRAEPVLLHSPYGPWCPPHGAWHGPPYPYYYGPTSYEPYSISRTFWVDPQGIIVRWAWKGL